MSLAPCLMSTFQALLEVMGQTYKVVCNQQSGKTDVSRTDLPQGVHRPAAKSALGRMEKPQGQSSARHESERKL